MPKEVEKQQNKDEEFTTNTNAIYELIILIFIIIGAVLALLQVFFHYVFNDQQTRKPVNWYRLQDNEKRKEEMLRKEQEKK